MVFSFGSDPEEKPRSTTELGILLSCLCCSLMTIYSLSKVPYKTPPILLAICCCCLSSSTFTSAFINDMIVRFSA